MSQLPTEKQLIEFKEFCIKCIELADDLIIGFICARIPIRIAAFDHVELNGGDEVQKFFDQLKINIEVIRPYAMRRKEMKESGDLLRLLGAIELAREKIGDPIEIGWNHYSTCHEGAADTLRGLVEGVGSLLEFENLDISTVAAIDEIVKSYKKTDRSFVVARIKNESVEAIRATRRSSRLADELGNDGPAERVKTYEPLPDLPREPDTPTQKVSLAHAARWFGHGKASRPADIMKEYIGSGVYAAKKVSERGYVFDREEVLNANSKNKDDAKVFSFNHNDK